MGFDFFQFSQLAFAPLPRLREIQDSLFRKHLAYTRENSPFYQQLLSRLGLDTDDLGIDDLRLLPLTEKRDLATRNQDFQAVPPEQVVDIVFSSGTTGKPARIVYTEHDLQRLAYNERQSFTAVGITGSDTVLLTCTMDRCFIAGLAYFLGVRSLGAAAIRNGHGTLSSHLEVIRQTTPNVLVGVPSFLLKLGRFMEQHRMSSEKGSIRALVCIGEPVRDRQLQRLPVAEQLVELWGAPVYSTYASSEIVSTFCECCEQQGGHLHPELALVEIIDQDGRPLPGGEVGEVVVTPMAVQGMPLLRFRTGDLSFLIAEACPCGRNSMRLGPILGRRDQLLKIRGTTVYPSAIAAVLDTIPMVQNHYIEVTEENPLSDQVTVHLAIDGDECRTKMIEEQLQARLRVKLKLKLEPLEMINQQVFSQDYRKPMRFIDRRKTR